MLKNNLAIILTGLITALILSPFLKYIASDDALFYLQIAYESKGLLSPSFNLAELTNGFHPLQYICLKILRNIFYFLNKTNFLYVAFCFGFICNSLSIFLLSKILKNILNKELLFLVCAFFAFYIYGGMFFSEASVNSLSIISFIYYALEVLNKNATRKEYLILGVLGSLSILARLDNIFFISITYSYLFIKKKNFNIAATLIANALLLLPYFLFNFSLFSSFMPVSGSIKSTFPVVRNLLSAWHETTILSRLTCAALLFSLVLSFFQKKKLPVFLCLAAGSLINWTYYFLFQHASFHSWYFVSGLLSASVILAYSAKNLFPEFTKSKYFQLACTILTSGILIAMPLCAYIKGTSHGRANLNELIMGRTWGKLVYYDVANQSAKILPKQERVLVFDLPGYLAYFGNLSVFAIDCLTLNKTACKQLYSNPKNYLKKNKIKYLIWNFPTGCTPQVEIREYYSQKLITKLDVNCEKAELVSDLHSIYIVPVQIKSPIPINLI